MEVDITIKNKREKILSDACFELKLSSEVKYRATRILDSADRERDSFVRVAEKNKIAASMYISCILAGQRRTQKIIGDYFGVSASTITAIYKRMAETIDIEIIL